MPDSRKKNCKNLQVILIKIEFLLLYSNSHDTLHKEK